MEYYILPSPDGYAVYVNCKVLVTCNSINNAVLIVDILEKDSMSHNADFIYRFRDYARFRLDRFRQSKWFR